MRKIVVLGLGLILIAAACNKSSTPVVDNTTTSPAETPTPAPAPTETPTPTPTPVATKVEIKMTASGFEPSAVTVKKGGTVTFVNSDGKPHWPASAPHPTHTDLPGFDALKALATGQSYSFTFTKVGKWGFHDHLNATKFGSVTVVE